MGEMGYIVAIVLICALSRGRFWGLASAISVSTGLMCLLSWRWGELNTYAGAWYTLIWSVGLSLFCLLIWVLAWIMAWCVKKFSMR